MYNLKNSFNFVKNLKNIKIMDVNTKNLISIGTAAEMKGVSLTTVYRWMESGLVDCVQVDKIRFIMNNEKFIGMSGIKKIRKQRNYENK